MAWSLTFGYFWQRFPQTASSCPLIYVSDLSRDLHGFRGKRETVNVMVVDYGLNRPWIMVSMLPGVLAVHVVSWARRACCTKDHARHLINIWCLLLVTIAPQIPLGTSVFRANHDLGATAPSLKWNKTDTNGRYYYSKLTRFLGGLLLQNEEDTKS